MTDNVYVLTEGIDDYNQFGEYFLMVFKGIPTIEQINIRDSCFGKINNDQYQSLIEDGFLQSKQHREFLYLKEVEL